MEKAFHLTKAAWKLGEEFGLDIAKLLGLQITKNVTLTN